MCIVVKFLRQLFCKISSSSLLLFSTSIPFVPLKGYRGLLAVDGCGQALNTTVSITVKAEEQWLAWLHLRQCAVALPYCSDSVETLHRIRYIRELWSNQVHWFFYWYRVPFSLFFSLGSSSYFLSPGQEPASLLAI